MIIRLIWGVRFGVRMPKSDTATMFKVKFESFSKILGEKVIQMKIICVNDEFDLNGKIQLITDTDTKLKLIDVERV